MDLPRLRWLARLGFAWSRRRLDEEARFELEAHCELLTQRYIAAGASADDARAAARRQLGNVTLVRQEIHQMNGIPAIDGIAHDLRYAGRQIKRSPGFAAVVVATLALAIGGTTAVFSVVQSVLLAPLPYERPGQLVRLYQQIPDMPASRHYVTGAHFSAVRELATSLEYAAAMNTYSEKGLDLVKDGYAARIQVLEVTSDYFGTLRAGALRGPGFDRADESGTQRIVLSDSLWRARFQGDEGIVGTTVQLSGRPYEIVGIAPAWFDDPIMPGVDAWVPYELVTNTYEENYSLSAIARLREGRTIDQARAELAALSRSLAERWPAARRSAIVAVPLRDDLVAPARGALQLVTIAVALVLFVACVNVANLVLVRASGRIQEFAVRAAIGCGPGRLVRQLLVENLLYALIGGSLGLVLALGGIGMLERLADRSIPRVDEIGFNATMLAVAMGVTLTTVLLFGLLPSLRFGRVKPVGSAPLTLRTATAGRGQSWMRTGLAAAQLGLALTLLVGAGVLAASFYRLQQVPLGFATDGVLTFDLGLPSSRYDENRRAVVQEEIARRIESIRGVRAAGGVSRLPATGSFHPWNAALVTGPRAGSSVNRGVGVNLQQRVISGDYLGAMSIPVLAGRTFDARDGVGAKPRALVSTGFVRYAYPGLSFEEVLGNIVRVSGRNLEIIGVAGDVALDPYGEPSAIVYHAHRQFADNRNWMLAQVVASDLPYEQTLRAVRSAIAGLDPDLVVHRPMPLAEVVGRGIGRERFALVLMGTFAAVAVVLAALGLYGVLAYGVRERTREIGIRMALGATTSQVKRLVLGQALVAIAVGVAAGVAGASLLGRWLSTLVFQVSPSDPRIVLTTIAVLTVTGLLAAWLPARRASHVDPRTAIQS